MRIAYVVKRYPRYSETFIVNEILAHEAAGLDVTIFALREPLDTHFQDIIARVSAPITYIPSGPVPHNELWRSLRKIREEMPRVVGLGELVDEQPAAIHQAVHLAQEASRQNIDHMHAHFGTVATTVARLASRWTGIPYSFTAHAKDIYHDSVDSEALDRKIADASKVVTISDFNLEYLGDRFPKHRAKMCRIYNGLDLQQFSYESPRKRPPVIVAVGRLVEKKGFDILIDACALLAARYRNFQCRIIGGGDKEEALRKQITDRELGKTVELLGPRPQGDVVREMTGAAALAAPCVVGSDGNRDGVPTTLLEAMALGTPCIATDVTGIPELIRSGETGLIVPQGNAPALADAMEALISDASVRVSLSQRARAKIESQFELHENAGELRRLFQSNASLNQTAALVS